MVVAGGYLLLTRQRRERRMDVLWLQRLRPHAALIGIGMLFYNVVPSSAGPDRRRRGHHRRGHLANLHIYFQPTSLFDTLVMLGLLAGGIGLVVRSFRAMPGEPK
jgi:hypothetical protein